MLDLVFDRSHASRRLRESSIGSLLDDFAAYLHHRGLRRDTMQCYVRSVDHLGRWLSRRRPKRRRINEESTRAFLDVHLPRCCCREHRATHKATVRAALRHLLRMLRDSGGLPKSERRRPSSIDHCIEHYQTHLRETCGLATVTIAKRTKHVRTFLEKRFPHGRFSPTKIRPGDLTTFVADFAEDHKPGTVNDLATCLRSFLRYLQMTGTTNRQLVASVPSVRIWKLDRLPRTMSDAQLDKFLAAFDRSTASGQRDYAIALCLADLGLRASEAARLRLDDINWSASTVKIAAGKNRRERVLPLSRRVGAALVVYLRHGRPLTTARAVFVRHRSSPGWPVTSEQIRGALRRVYARVPGCEGLTGTHVLRHTAATRLHCRGVALKDIADLLGHQCIDTTAIYTKLDLPKLSKVAMPWPGEVH